LALAVDGPPAEAIGCTPPAGERAPAGGDAPDAPWTQRQQTADALAVMRAAQHFRNPHDLRLLAVLTDFIARIQQARMQPDVCLTDAEFERLVQAAMEPARHPGTIAAQRVLMAELRRIRHETMPQAPQPGGFQA
jgi:hypothetical protein